jgi:hypothetical protein
MDNFETTWHKIDITRNGESVSPELRHMLKIVYREITKPTPNLFEIKTSLEKLLSYLTSPSGRTSANCYATDLFFSVGDWNVDWEIFPEELTNIIGDIGGALHDTISHPEIAASFNGLPEQLLEDIRRWIPD